MTRIVVPSAVDLASAAARPVSVETGLPASEISVEIAAGRLRPEWSVVAYDDAGELVGRAMWWGRDATVPLALDVWDVDARWPDRERLAAALLGVGHETLSSRGVDVPLPHTMRLPNDWRDDPALVGEVDLSTPDQLARAEVDYYRACPGDRSWWRTAATPDGTVVGIAIPSATPTSRNVGYLAVLPQFRGRRYVDEILAFITRFHAEHGAERVTATTDAVNAPMAAGFRRAGYRGTETRLDLTAP